MMDERMRRSKMLVQVARGVEDLIREHDLYRYAPTITVERGRTIFAADGTVLEGYVVTARIPDAEEANTYLSFSIFLDEDFQRVCDDVLSLDEAAVLGMET